jgi:preprotein translocase subunit SecG
MSGLLLVLLVALIFVVLYQVARSSEMVARIQGEETYSIKGEIKYWLIPCWY